MHEMQVRFFDFRLRFLQKYDDYKCIFGIKLQGLSLSFLKGHAVKLKCVVDYKIF